MDFAHLGTIRSKLNPNIALERIPAGASGSWERYQFNSAAYSDGGGRRSIEASNKAVGAMAEIWWEAVKWLEQKGALADVALQTFSRKADGSLVPRHQISIRPTAAAAAQPTQMMDINASVAQATQEFMAAGGSATVLKELLTSFGAVLPVLLAQIKAATQALTEESGESGEPQAGEEGYKGEEEPPGPPANF